jgi:hypothetical protein
MMAGNASVTCPDPQVSHKADLHDLTRGIRDVRSVIAGCLTCRCSRRAARVRWADAEQLRAPLAAERHDVSADSGTNRQLCRRECSLMRTRCAPIVPVLSLVSVLASVLPASCSTQGHDVRHEGRFVVVNGVRLHYIDWGGEQS